LQFITDKDSELTFIAIIIVVAGNFTAGTNKISFGEELKNKAVSKKFRSNFSFDKSIPYTCINNVFMLRIEWLRS